MSSNEKKFVEVRGSDSKELKSYSFRICEHNSGFKDDQRYPMLELISQLKRHVCYEMHEISGNKKRTQVSRCKEVRHT